MDLDNAILTLQQWPLSWIDWPVQNSQRLDIEIDKDVGRHMGQITPSSSHILMTFYNWLSNTDATIVLPYDEITFLRWNADPYTMDGGSGYNDVDPSAVCLTFVFFFQ